MGLFDFFPHLVCSASSAIYFGWPLIKSLIEATSSKKMTLSAQLLKNKEPQHIYMYTLTMVLKIVQDKHKVRNFMTMKTELHKIL